MYWSFKTKWKKNTNTNSSVTYDQIGCDAKNNNRYILIEFKTVKIAPTRTTRTKPDRLRGNKN